MNALRPEHGQEHEQQLKSNLVSNKWELGTDELTTAIHVLSSIANIT